jgi:negative regulator of sigma-B (phosphoserine phosphatase)
MIATASGKCASIDWGIAGLALGGGQISGDLYMVAPHAAGALVAVVDGLGHGPEAAIAARAATTVLANHADLPVTELMALCHEALRRTRGAVLSIALFDETARQIIWLGIGNVQGILIRSERRAPKARESLLLRGGVVGYQIPTLRAAALPIGAGDVLILATDGIAGDLAGIEPGDQPAQNLADDILHWHGKNTDDALVLVARYRGPPS